MSGIDDAGARERLKAAMDERRSQLRVTWAEIAHRAGMSAQNLYRIRENKISVSWDAERGIERALRWSSGSVGAILDGRQPIELARGDSAGPSELDTEPATAEPEPDYSESSIGYPVGSDEWLMHYAEYPEVVRAGLEVRRKRRELEGLLALIAERAATIAEGALPNGGGERS